MSFKIVNPIRLIETFSGIGTFSMALRDLNVPFEIWKTSDWDVNAVKAYKKIHFSDDNTDYSKGKNKEELAYFLYRIFNVSLDGKEPATEAKLLKKKEEWLREVYNAFEASHNLGSITGIYAQDLDIKRDDKYFYLLSYSFPCQDISLAGKRMGFTEGTGTRSSLLWEIRRILFECKAYGCLPDCLIMENVSAIHTKKNFPDFQKWLDFLDGIGYHTKWTDLNSKNFGVAQSRDRTFVVSILSNEEYEFPEPILCNSRIKDYLEDKVDEKYYINNEKAQKLIKQLIERGELPRESK